MSRSERNVLRKMRMLDRALSTWGEDAQAYDRAFRQHADFLEKNPDIRLSDVTPAGEPIFEKTQSLNAAKTISANKVWPGGGVGMNLTGAGVAMSLFDNGVMNSSHQEFGGRVLNIQPGFGTKTHATNMAGIMAAAGVNSALHGMAGAATVRYYGSGALTDGLTMEAVQGTQLSNHSTARNAGWDNLNLTCSINIPGGWVWWGVINHAPSSGQEDPAFGKYTEDFSGLYDQIMVDAETLLPIYSSGNSRATGPRDFFNGQPMAVTHTTYPYYPCTTSTVFRPWNGDPDGDGYYDTISPSGVMKNVLTIGAVHDIPGGYQNPSNVQLWTNSSIGPTDDGRIKPDLVANGVDVSTTSTGSNTASGAVTGTSPATASVTGGLALLLQNHANLHPGANPMYASTIKALAIHTADEAGAHSGPDFKFGWGLVNIRKAAQLQTANAASNSKPHIKEILLNEGGLIEFPVLKSTTGELKVTIAWTDPVPTVFSPASAVDDTTKALVNDLDLRVITSNGTVTHLPWTLDADVVLERKSVREQAAVPGDNDKDNVEQVYISSLSPQTCTIRITHKGTSLVGGQQLVSVIISGNAASTAPDPEFLDAEPDFSPGNSGLNLSFQTVAGGWYQLHQCLDLTNPTWLPIPGEISAPGNITTLPLPWEATEGGYYFKLVRTE